MNSRSNTYLAYQIISLVASHYEVSLKELICGKSGNAWLARGSAVYAIRKHTNLPLPTIGSLLGYDTIENVLCELKLYDAATKKDPHLQHIQNLIKGFVTASTDLQRIAENEPTAENSSQETFTVADPTKEQCLDEYPSNKWDKIIAYLEEHFGAVAVAMWFEDAKVVEFTEDSLKLEVGSEFQCKIIKRRCLNLIQDALKEIFGSEATVEVSVNRT